jgi:integrase
VGFAKKRIGRDGKPRYTACYLDLKGRERSAGTFSSKKQADQAWQAAEVEMRKGRAGDPARGRQTFKQYVEQTWLPNHQIEVSTREAYAYSIHKHLMPEFGPMRMIDILPEHVRAWIARLKADGVTPSTIRYNKIILSAIFTTAMDDQVTFLHPCKGVRTPPVPKKPLQIITPEQFDQIYQALPVSDYQLLVETEIESGLRWGELTELRVKDLDRTRVLTVSRAVVEVNPKYHPTDGRPWSRTTRKTASIGGSNSASRSSRSCALTSQPRTSARTACSSPCVRQTNRRHAFVSCLTPTRWASPSRTPRAGDISTAHSAATPREGVAALLSGGVCDLPRQATRFRQGQPAHPPCARDRWPHPRDWFRRTIWTPACTAAGLAFTPTMRDLRHAHASWLLAGGADLQVVKERLGHATIGTTERYLHTLPNADETAGTNGGSRSRSTRRA